jgi:hypothetical protein
LITAAYILSSLAFAGVYWGLRAQFDPPLDTFADTFIYSGGRMVGLDGQFNATGAGASIVSLVQAFFALIGRCISDLGEGCFVTTTHSQGHLS